MRTLSQFGYFRSITLSDQEIHTRDYEAYLYGSREAWRGHGAFQLFFLKAMGFSLLKRCRP